MENIRVLQEIDLAIAKVFVDICDRHHLTYYMLGGTMLGAVRHKGFIPWDDDIDLGMPRRDYERFLKIAPRELPSHMRIENFRTDPDYMFYITRILDTDTKVIEERIGNDTKYTNASIDIFPIDGTPNRPLLRKIYFFRVLSHRACMALCYKDSLDRKRKRGAVEKVFLAIMERIPVEKLTTPYTQKCKIDRLLKSQDVDRSDYIGNIMGAYRTREIVPKKWYGKGRMYPFEDMELRGFEDADAYLTYTFGHYMELPPEDQRKVHFILLEAHGKQYGGA